MKLQIKEIFEKSFYIFNHRQKIRLACLIFILFMETVFELLGVISVYPFIALILNPAMIETNKMLNLLYTITGCNSKESFFVLVAVLIVLLYLVKNAFNAVASYFRYGFVFNTKREIGVRLMRDYMKERYSFFLKHNSAELMRSVGSDVSIFFDMVLQCLYFFSDGLMIICFGVYLFCTDLLLSTVCFGVMLLFVFGFVRKNKARATMYGKKAQEGSGSMTQWLQQGFGGIKEIKILQREDYFVNNFQKYFAISNKMNQKFSFLNQIPHMVLECFCTGAVLIVIVVRVLNGDNVADFIPSMAVFAMALFRIFPRVSRLNQSVNTMIFSYPYLETVYNDIKITEENQSKIDALQELGKNENALTFNDNITVKDVTFIYPNTDKKILDNVSLSIKKGEAVGLVGPSGAGKSTLADVILGILEVSTGAVTCDGKNIEHHVKEWSQKLGYIPQTIFLSDDTIRNNVAFGLDVNKEVDQKVWQALEQAQLADYVRTLPEGLDTMLGERGVRFSGGQRQRIGIARALYNNPEILVLDEATSALDNETEKAVMDSIENLLGKKTMIIIAHRVSTIKNCNVIYKVENGKVQKISYEQIYGNS